MTFNLLFNTFSAGFMHSDLHIYRYSKCCAWNYFDKACNVGQNIKFIEKIFFHVAIVVLLNRDKAIYNRVMCLYYIIYYTKETLK